MERKLCTVANCRYFVHTPGMEFCRLHDDRLKKGLNGTHEYGRAKPSMVMKDRQALRHMEELVRI